MADRTLLIVDDSESIRHHVRQVLADRHVFDNFLLAGDGVEGFKILLGHSVDLVLCDLMMPGIDGIKFVSLMQQKPELAEIPIIMLTGQEDIKAKVKSLDAGASDYLIKPIHDEELVARVKVHLKIKQLQDELRDKNARLEELSTTDGLTKITNRRKLIEVLELEFLRAERYQKHLAYVMADIDHFKALNDDHGHQVGDQALAAVASVLKSALRAHDIVGRYGGEEFGLVLPETDLVGATAVAERCRQGIEKLAIMSGKKVVHVTTSFGVGIYPGGKITNVQELIREADDALYRAKKAGRNQVAAPNLKG